MRVCPLSILAGCRRCPVVAVCPLKGTIGDHRPDDEPSPEERSDDRETPRPGSRKE